MAEIKKYFVARGPFHVPAPVIEEGDIVELDSAEAAQFVREGTLNPSGFECGGDGLPVVSDADAQAKADAEAAQAEADAKAKADADAEAKAKADAEANGEGAGTATGEAPKVGDTCKLEDGTDGVLAENPDGADKPLVCVAPAGE